MAGESSLAVKKVTIETLHTLWVEDGEISYTDLGRASTKIPNLVGKYLGLLAVAKMQLKSQETKYFALRLDKFNYYMGRMSHEELNKRNWSPFLMKVLRADVDMYLDADADLQVEKAKMEYSKSVITTLDGYLSDLNKRNFTIKNAIDWLKFTNGTTT